VWHSWGFLKCTYIDTREDGDRLHDGINGILTLQPLLPFEIALRETHATHHLRSPSPPKQLIFIMETQDDSAYPVYLGVWTNWSKGAVLGRTLTLSRSDGNLLIAFFAFFVGFVGNRLWRILCFALHSKLSSSKARDGVYHQRQAVLRNASTAIDGLVFSIQIIWAWRRVAGRPWRLAVNTVLLAVTCSAAAIAASGFSSRISGGTEVLVKSGKCGIHHRQVDPATTTYDSLNGNWTTLVSKLFVGAANYAQECYSTQRRTGMLGCSTFVQQSLPFTVDTEAPCPFEPSLCVTQDSNIRLEANLLDSNDHLGINSKPEDRIQLRRVLHCAPLVTQGYKSEGLSSHGSLSNVSTTRYHYGQKYIVGSNFSYEHETQAYVVDGDMSDYRLG